MIKKILILSANPGDTSRLRLDKEVREIEEGLKRAAHREQFDIYPKWAVSFWDIRRALLEYKPHFVHFTGHGEKEGLMVEGDLGIAVPISSKVLSGLFALCSDHVECVILNACYSAPQAAAINKHIKHVIGMRKKIKDTAAIEFAVGFYDALGAGRSVEDAFKFGLIAIQQVSQGLPEHLIPILKEKKEKRTSPQPPPSPDLIKKGLKSLDLEEYYAAFETFKEARQLMPENEQAQAFYCITFLSGKPIRSIKKSDMNEIYKTLKKIVNGKNQEVANLARIVLSIIWYDYYLKEDDRYQELFFKENVKYLMTYQPTLEEKQWVSHIVCSDNARTLSKLR